MKYELKTSLDGKREYVLRDNQNGTFSEIPVNPANGDYQAYLAWLENPEAEQSTPNLAANAD